MVVGEARAMSESTAPGKMRDAAVRGSTIIVAGSILSAGLRFGSNLIITRLLLPEHFGLMAIVNVLALGLALFSDVGVGPNIIQNQRGDQPRFLDTAWTVQVSRGFILWILSCVLAWPLALLYEQESLTVLLPVVGITAVIGGFESTNLFTLNRALSFMRITVLELVVQLSGAIAMIVVAWLYHSVWALVVATLVSSVARTVLSHVMLPGHRNRFAWDRDAARSLFTFGRWILVSTAVTYLAGQTDRLALGKLVTPAELGLYSIAATLASMPTQILVQLAQKVFFPVVAAALRDSPEARGGVRRSRANLVVTLAPLLALAVAMAPAAVELLYDERYRATGQLASLLSIAAWFGTLSHSYGVVLLAAGRPQSLTLANVVKTITFAVLVWPVASRFGLTGVTLLVAVGELGFLVTAQLACRREGVVGVVADVGATQLGAVLVALYLGAHHLLSQVLPWPVLPFGVVALLGLGITAVLAKKTRLLGR